MIQADYTVRLEAPMDRAWKVLSNLAAVAGCLPACEEVKVEGDRATVTLRVAELGGPVKVNLRVVEAAPPRWLKLRAWNPHVGMTVQLGLSPLDDAACKVSLHLELEPLSTLGRLILGLARQGVGSDQAKRFGECVKRRVEEDF
jgi:hypothetical protein